MPILSAAPPGSPPEPPGRTPKRSGGGLFISHKRLIQYNGFAVKITADLKIGIIIAL